jgi:DNA-binding SARP family transcriptional activator
MYFFILGSLEVRGLEARIPVTAPKQRTVLAALLLEASNEVSVDRLVKFMWDGAAPASAVPTLQSYIYRLRRQLHMLPNVELLTSPEGYQLKVAAGSTDLEYFRREVALARERTRHGDYAGAVPGLRRALAIWRGDALAGIPGELVRQEARFLDGERLAAYEELYGAEIALGNHRQIIPELQKIVTVHHFHEGIRAQLMLCLYAAGRQAEALQHFMLIRNQLRADLGIEPGRELQELNQAILEQRAVGEMAWSA